MEFKYQIVDNNHLLNTISVSAEGWEAPILPKEGCHPIAGVQAIEATIRSWSDPLVMVSVRRDAGWGEWVASRIFEPIWEDGTNRWLSAALAAQREAEGQRLSCPPERRMRSVFLAGIRRGRDAVKFSEEIWKQAVKLGNPLMDPLPASRIFTLEYALLDREKESYARDVERAKQFCAFVPCGTDKKRCVLEGIWIEDPESVLFVDWAWNDLKTSKQKTGFGLAVVKDHFCWRIAADPQCGVYFDHLADNLEQQTGKAWRRAPEIEVNAQRVRIADSTVGWRSLWCEDPSIPQEKLEQVIREYCEGGLFARGAAWNRSGDGIEAELKPVPDGHGTEGAGIKLIRCQLSPDLGYKIPKAAADTIYLGLWTLVRPVQDRRTGRPPGFDEHCQGDSGILTVWSRLGIAAGWSTPDAQGLMKNLEELCKQLSSLRSRSENASAESENASADSENVSAEKERMKLFEEFGRMREKLTKPENRLLRRLFERLNLAEAHRAHVDLQLTRDIARLTEQNNKLTTQNHLMEEKFKFLELLIIAFYGFEFIHLLVQDTIRQDAGHWPWAEALGSLFLASVAIVLFLLTRPYLEKQGSRTRVLWTMLLVTVLAVGYVFTGSIRHQAHLAEEKAGQEQVNALDLRTRGLEALTQKELQVLETLLERSRPSAEKRPAATAKRQRVQQKD